jgi:drug/metabolite transporter (DMT)-like permease
MPVVGIVLGVTIAGEPIDARIIGGTVLVIAGVALVNSRYGRKPLYVRRAQRSTATETEVAA